jgi:uncharacterized protein (TIGR03000 family)
MFGLILATVMTVGSSAPAFHFHSCHGCHGCHGYVPVVYYKAPIVYSGCWGGSSCFGGCFGGCGGCYGCCGGCHGGFYSYSSCYGCCGGCYGSCFGSCYGCCGGCYGGCHGSCFGGCCGAILVSPAVPAVPAAPAAPTAPATPKKTSATNATVEIQAPMEAEVTFNGVVVKRKSEKEVFKTPELQAGQPYHYTVKVKMGDQTETKIVSVEAGATVAVDLRELISARR